LPFAPRPAPRGLERLVVVGASTGGTEALKVFLTAMPSVTPPILIAQHMPEMFTRSFAARLDHLCRIRVKEAEHGEPVLPGVAYIAPGHSHLLLTLEQGRFVCALSNGQPVNRHRPSVDVLFRSAANCAGMLATGVILTGMGKDGAAGMLEMKHAGGYNFAQDEASSVVFGMPKEAIALGAVDEVCSLGEMAQRVLMHVVAPRR
jgi:two-component system chemotaxis response regulator CheB